MKHPKASILWAKLSSNPDSIINPNSSPGIPNFQWTDPSKIQLNIIDQLWEFYYDCIQELVEPIVFVVGDEDSSDNEKEVMKKPTKKPQQKERIVN